MLRRVAELFGYKILATNGNIGKVHDFYFDDEVWIIRYMIADAGGWLTHLGVLIFPIALSQPDWKNRAFPVKMTKEKIEASPEIDAHKPVSRQNELDLSKHYQWPAYWVLSEVSSPIEAETIMKSIKQADQEYEDKEEEGLNLHLRSTRKVMGYHIHAKDGDIGHVEDFIVDDEEWILRYLVIDTRNWLPGGKKVSISPDWVEDVEWALTKVHVNLTVEKIKGGPEYHPVEPVNREYEIQLYDFYGRPKYRK